jgi:phage terminase small subunit
MTQLPRTPPYACAPLLLPAPTPAPGKRTRLRPLTPKQQTFIAEYLVDLNARQAAIRAGYKGGPTMGSQHFLVRNPKIAAAIATEMEARAERLRISGERVLLELARVAFSDIGRIVDWKDGRIEVTPAGKLAADDRAAIAEVTLAPAEGGIAARVKLHDKQQALKTLARHLNLIGRFAQPTSQESPAAAADRARAMIRERLARIAAAQAEEEQELDDRLREAQDPSEEEAEEES